MRLVLKPNTGTNNVLRAVAMLRSKGLRVAYAKQRDNSVLLCTDRGVSTAMLRETVSGCIAGCRRQTQPDLIVCDEMPGDLRNIDLTTLRTTNFETMKAKFGIEAARKCIHEELKRMLRCFNVKLLERHLELLCDVMTTSGTLVGCNRHGMKKKSPERALWLATFERPTDPLTQAAANQFKDPVRGHMDRLVLGQPMHNPYFDVCHDKAVERVHAKQHNEITDADMNDDFDFGGDYVGADTWIPQQNHM